MPANIPNLEQKRVVIIGAGFAGLSIARDLVKQNMQIVLVDKNNYHQFQPLFYQVATAGLEPSSIAFPLRKIFQNKKNIHIRIANVENISTTEQRVYTSLGPIRYDYLIIATGCDTNFFGNQQIKENSIPMKSISEALQLRNAILENFEKTLTIATEEERAAYMNIIIVGAGPTGVELAGTLAEMKKHILPKDYAELDFTKMNIQLVSSGDRVLETMSSVASAKALEFLEKLGVNVLLDARVVSYDGHNAILDDGRILPSKTVIWAAGIKGNSLQGIDTQQILPNGRIKVDNYNKILGYENVFAVGDIACMSSTKYPSGHPQVAQVALQQGDVLAKNMVALLENKPMKEFQYKDLGSMATVGKNLAVVDLPQWKFQGFFAWLVWMFIHLIAILGAKNKILVFINWLWNYITYDQSLRLIIRSTSNKNTADE